MARTANRLAGLGLLVFIGGAHAQGLFGATAGGAPGELYTLNPATGGMLQDIGPLNDAIGANYGITGLAFHPVTGVLYGSSANFNEATRARLVTINPGTGAVTLIGLFNAGPVSTSGAPSTMSDIAFDSAGNLFGIGSIGGPQLYSINTSTGQATVIGNTGLTSTAGGGLAISDAGVFYGTPTASRFGTYDPGTGAYTNIANPTRPLGGAYAALAFNGSNALYGLNIGVGSPQPTELVIIDPATGAVTNVGLSVDQLDAIAFRPVPGPCTVAVLGLGVVPMLRRKRQRAVGRTGRGRVARVHRRAKGLTALRQTLAPAGVAGFSRFGRWH